MTREEKLNALGKLGYVLIWPDDWDDVGFTEREIWVNSQGYGYIMCDEPTDPDFERDWVDKYWSDMDDELLSDWIDRLSAVDDPILVEWAKDLVLDDISCDVSAAIIRETNEYKKHWSAHNTKYFSFVCSTTVFEGEKKRDVAMVAEGKDECRPNDDVKHYVTRTVLDITASRNNLIAHYDIAGTPETGSVITNGKLLGKWEPVAEKLYTKLLEMVLQVVKNDPYAQSIELFRGLRDALGTTALDNLISSKEND